MEKLYDLAVTTDSAKCDLYIKNNKCLQEGPIPVSKGLALNFSTYFNSFHTIKWKEYTSLEKLSLHLRLKGKFKVSFFEISSKGTSLLKEENTKNDDFSDTFNVTDLHENVLGFTLEALDEDCRFLGGAWYGEFSEWEEKKVGISITTFRREEYVKRTMSTLSHFSENHPWLKTLIVDNGSTLPEEERENLRVIHNRNYGGSGGFTRGIMEYMDEGMVDYILLMDDDINLEPSAIERTHSLLCGLKDKYKDSFLAGAMLSMEKPWIQHENTAYWDKIVSKVCFHGLDLVKTENLAINGIRPRHPNDYAGWWYCAIPSHRVKEIGLPLPFFIKSDDMEYGIRNDRPVLCMNGIGVWHEVFEKKLNLVMRFFSDRNTFILNHYANGCGRMTLLVSILARIAKRCIHGNWDNLAMLYVALKEYKRGFGKITKYPADQYFADMRDLGNKISYLNILKLPIIIMLVLADYGSLHKAYMDFRSNEMETSAFWKKYLVKKV